MTVSCTERASQALLWVLVLYAAASLLHFAHNAEYLAQYPNLPASWSRGDVYLAWCCLTTLGVGGYVFWLRGKRTVGLTLLTVYAALGFGGLLHYTRAPLTQHSSLMNLTIWAEAFGAALLLMDVVWLARGARPHAA
ncbi:MAG TPA: hypothetical protein VH109_11600 [Steroidobacteraceae bacterium]|jgi:hypothetical protein|nr:hypothetical protein [Steroidobacteraceae bacterium]